uniref:Uncharacterized protein n=1 Tax=Anguilla anguilla TaxID=7936 RepID=A0A0E9VYM9_ANGAN
MHKVKWKHRYCLFLPVQLPFPVMKACSHFPFTLLREKPSKNGTEC